MLNFIARPPAVDALNADFIVIAKAAHRLTLVRRGHPIAVYRVALGRGGVGPKVRAGDDRVPEGTYLITARNADSAFHRALRIGYPNEAQRRDASRRGIDPGGDIMIHGIRNGLGWIGPAHRLVDWTRGCVAVTDPEMDQIWRLVPVGTRVEIDP